MIQAVGAGLGGYAAGGLHGGHGQDRLPAGSVTAELIDFSRVRQRDRTLVSHADLLLVQRRAAGNRRT